MTLEKPFEIRKGRLVSASRSEEETRRGSWREIRENQRISGAADKFMGRGNLDAANRKETEAVRGVRGLWRNGRRPRDQDVHDVARREGVGISARLFQKETSRRNDNSGEDDQNNLAEGIV